MTGLRSTPVGSSLIAALSREEKERLRDRETDAAERLLYGGGAPVGSPEYTGEMIEASAHASLALLWQARIEWEHDVGH